MGIGDTGGGSGIVVEVRVADWGVGNFRGYTCGGSETALIDHSESLGSVGDGNGG